MKDLDKIKIKNNKPGFKSVFTVGLIVLSLFGFFFFVIISLSAHYYNLRKNLRVAEQNNYDTMTTDPNEGSEFVYDIEEKKIKLKALTKDFDTLNELKNKVIVNHTPTVDEKKASAKKYPTTENRKTGQIYSNNRSSTSPKNNDKEQVGDITYVIQLESVRKQSDAIKTVNKLEKKVNNLYIYSGDSDKKGRWYKVRCCEEDDYNLAEKTQKHIIDNLGIKAIVVQTKKDDGPVASRAAKSENKRGDSSKQGLYVVQLASLKGEATAKKALNSLKNKIDGVYITRWSTSSGIWYSVRCCNTDDRKEAEKTQKYIIDNLGIKAIVVQTKKDDVSVAYRAAKSENKRGDSSKQGLYVVQLASLKGEATAKKALNSLKNKIDGVYITRWSTSSGIWYSVRCCNTDDRKEAEKAQKYIIDNLGIKAIVVQTR